jgi:hypothetical protein
VNGAGLKNASTESRISTEKRKKAMIVIRWDELGYKCFVRNAESAGSLTANGQKVKPFEIGVQLALICSRCILDSTGENFCQCNDDPGSWMTGSLFLLSHFLASPS